MSNAEPQWHPLVMCPQCDGACIRVELDGWVWDICDHCKRGRRVHPVGQYSKQTDRLSQEVA